MLQVGKDGRVDVIAVKVSWTYKGDERVVHNPFTKLSAEEIRGLRGVFLDDWPNGIAERLKHLDLERVCIRISDSTAQDRKDPGEPGTMPTLPEKVQYLNIEEHSNSGIGDYSGLARYKSLRFLRARAMTGVVDLATLEGAIDIRHLDLTGSAVKNTKSLAKLTQLRHLGLPYTRGTDDIAFAAQMPELVVMDIRRTNVADLTPLGELKKLARVDARETRVRTLPAGPLPALRELQLFSAPLTDGAVAAFAKDHAECRILFRWEKVLADALRGVDRIRVRSGGTCHRDLAREKTLFEEKEAKEIAALIKNLHIDEEKSGFHCMCCGSPSFEFYDGKKLVGTLGFHHGRSVRWPGVWPSDGALTPASAEFLCTWLADRGLPDAKKEYDEIKRQQSAGRRRAERINAILPKPVRDDLREAGSLDQRLNVFDKHFPEPADRAQICFQLLGREQIPWNLASSLDLDLFQVMRKVKGDGLVKALAESKTEPALSGAGRWLFGNGGCRAVDWKGQDQLFTSVARHALGHPQPRNRRMTLDELGNMKGEMPRQLLRAVLNGEIKVRPLDKDERPDDEDPPEGSDSAHAALLLAKLGDVASLPAIRAQAKKATGEDAPIFQRAREMLEKKE